MPRMFSTQHIISAYPKMTETYVALSSSEMLRGSQGFEEPPYCLYYIGPPFQETLDPRWPYLGCTYVQPYVKPKLQIGNFWVSLSRALSPLATSSPRSKNVLQQNLGLVAELENQLGQAEARKWSAHGHWPSASRPSQAIQAGRGHLGRGHLGRPRSFGPAEITEASTAS